MKWRRLLYVLHRDIGFLAFGLTLVYMVSGIAVNHRHHWDYNYSIDFSEREIGGPAALLGIAVGDQPAGTLARDRQDDLVAAVGQATGRAEPPRKVIWRGRDRLSLFFGDKDFDIVDYLPEQGKVEITSKRPRFLVRDFNRLHLNELRTKWTYFGDLYAVALLFLAVSGIVMVKGKRGLRGTGGIYTALGIAIPILFLIVWG